MSIREAWLDILRDIELRHDAIERLLKRAELIARACVILSLALCALLVASTILITRIPQ